MEQQLQPPKPAPNPPVLSDKHNGRATRGLDLSSKYTELIPKNRREEVERETLRQEALSEPSVMDTNVLALYAVCIR
jgi:hypothetical protein